MGYAFDGTDHIFTMTLDGIPDQTDFAGIYGIYIDDQDGGTAAEHAYVPQVETATGLETLTGIDKILDSHYISSNNAWERSDYHFGYDDNSFVFTAYPAGLALFSTDQTGTPDSVELVWQIAESAINIGTLGTDFTFYGGTITELSGGAITHDFATVPLPGAAWLVLTGLCIAGLHRKIRKN